MVPGGAEAVGGTASVVFELKKGFVLPQRSPHFIPPIAGRDYAGAGGERRGTGCSIPPEADRNVRKILDTTH